MQTASLYKLWFLLLMLGILTVPAPVLLTEESKAPGKPDRFPFPIKVDVKGQPVFICCEGCRDSLLDNPDKYLANLPREGIK